MTLFLHTKITSDYQDKYVRTVGTTDPSASVCAGSGIHFVWAGAQGAPLGEAELYIFYTLVTSAFPLLTAVHLLLCHFFSSLFIDIEHACLFCHSVTAIVLRLLQNQLRNFNSPLKIIPSSLFYQKITFSRLIN